MNNEAATTEIRTLTLSTGSFDQENTFQVETRQGRIPSRAKLHQGYEKEGDSIYWAMATGGCVKSHYTDADRAETARLQAEQPLRHGDLVMIEGRLHKVRVLGDYSDCAIFDPA